MNNHKLLGEFVQGHKLSPIRLKQTIQGMYINGELPQSIREYSVEVKEATSGDYAVFYYIYQRFNNIIEITL